MDISSQYNSSSVGSDLKRGESDLLSSLSGGRNPLDSLGDRVSSAIKQDDQAVNSVDSQAVKRMISDLFAMPQAGTTHNSVV
ncbi:hypothetical protein A3K48_00935 [candidate division WOR-1 bacterium RIFOXYA12_FULL_52_29]|uniref:Uncharacterized protein n=1 Tax=candidate division WOR-1 bacterium RIFOXYC12_FULL_54_18 TaxID=1802584 RepID=A0A1F4T4E1_UNCSA|nr:MAG: hypothetical protein A3K44_00935 [candidate division WOR-1 bacterium RIFOXYA2_FULL_51_19]OGC17157.1 MAG: hypothetical protein A3K48_00935 [candidate division WOR-1 bacterium RIFOXYA12_FULL_52_29]OGC26017.1 MAG: hypothetical protein A3K32_00930 [candidate division WOR-1 bacterium RIFOXYB2_FULL_45_9]OGC27574.1 MAG: hypothetical protein A3K49_00935 [candidate division WOR-1 bacterium RIFOXYC12_FULL_54_18]OGC29213.1 MAG: hypothetical protein A2346_00775 [candidate division WOR-1 bacterium R